MGGDATIEVEGLDKFLLATDEDAFDAFTKAATRRDEYGVAELVLRGKLFTVPTGTRVRVIDMGGFLGSRLQVRVMEGAQVGRSGWIATEFVKALP